MQTLILILGGITAEEKVGALLVNLADRLSGDTSAPVLLPVGRYDIADFFALSVETVSRAPTSLKERGVISLIGPLRVSIVDREGAAKEVEPAGVGGDWLILKAVPSSSTKSAPDVYKQTLRRSSGRWVALTRGLTKLLYIPAAVARQ